MIRLDEYNHDFNKDISEDIEHGVLDNYEISILKDLARSQALNHYDDNTRLDFELKLRKQIIQSALALSRSGVTYAVFEDSYCNSEYWILQENGGFKLRPQVKPSTAIRDIYTGGSQYAFECATAMVIVYYYAVLQVITENQFNQLFAQILLWDWHYDKDLGITTIKTNEFIPGDVLYFDNPDVNPLTPEWQGENVVYLERDSYYGHGIGIKSAQDMIAALNEHRKPGAIRSAHLLNQTTRPDFQYLSQFTSGPLRQSALSDIHALLPTNLVARIGSQTYLQV